VALCKARISAQPLWGFSSSNPHHSQSRAEQVATLFQNPIDYTKVRSGKGMGLQKELPPILRQVTFKMRNFSSCLLYKLNI
jgi:hypothetical protein